MPLEPGEFELRGFLANSSLFGGLSAEELTRMALSCQVRRYARGDLIFRAGEPCDAFFMVMTGRIKLFLLSPAGQEKVVEIISPGQSFAEALVFLDKPYIVSAQVLADAMLVSVSKQGVIREIQQDARLALHMLAGISKRLHGLIQDVEGYALNSGLQRLIGFLLRDVVANPDQVPNTAAISLPASKATIASRLSLSPEYFSRVLHELESAQLITIDRREIRILDVQKLMAFGTEQG
jgi:CRP-like cAMP-binding protein